MYTEHFNIEDFETEVLESDIPVLLDFYAKWCGPCHMLTPVIDEIAKEADGYTVGKVDVDESPELAEKYNITNIPTLLVIKDGNEIARSSGIISKEKILEMIK